MAVSTDGDVVRSRTAYKRGVIADPFGANIDGPNVGSSQKRL